MRFVLSLLMLVVAMAAHAQIPSNGLVAWYPFNGNANDESGNGNDGVVNGANLTVDRFGNANGAYSFDGVNSLIEIVNSTHPVSDFDVSYSLWYKCFDSNQDRSLISVGPACCYNNRSAVHKYVWGNLGYIVNGPDFGTSYNLVLEEWHHVVFTKSGLEITLYVDGILNQSGSLTNVLNIGNSDIHIGGNGSQSNNNGEHFLGILDDVSIYNRALNPSEIQQLYQDQTGQVQQNTTCLPDYVPTSGLVGYWPFCGNANDESGNGNDGVVNGATLTTDRNGNTNSAYSFNGTSDNIIIQNSALNDADDFTISVWVNLSQSKIPGFPQHYIIDNGAIGNGVFLNSDLDQTQFPCNDFNSGITIQTWHHLIGIKHGDIFDVYIDGSLVNSGQGCANVISDVYPFVIGSTTINTEFLSGVVDDVCLYNRALTPQEIQALYLSGQSPCSPVTNTISASVVQGQSYTLGTQTLTTAGTYTEVFTSTAGCDSTVTLTLSVEPLLTCNITATTTTICAGESVELSMDVANATGSDSQLPLVLQEGLMAFYPFNGSALDISQNGNHPTTSTLQYGLDRFSNENGAGWFSGNQYAIVPNSNSLQVAGDFSIAYWVFLNTNFPSSGWWNTKAIFTKDNDYPYGAKVFITPEGDSLSIYFGTNMWDATQGFGKKIHRNQLLGNWHHFTWVHLGSTGQLYLDGNLILTQNSNPNWGSANNLDLHIGVNGDPAGNYPYKFVGRMDDLGFWSRALAPNEIAQLMESYSYNWSTGSTGSTISISPTTNTTYSCTVTQGNSTCTTSIDITVNPAVTNAISATMIEGESYTLGTQTLTTAGTYTEVFTSVTGCDSTVTLTLAVEPLLTCNITTATTTLCLGESVNLSMSTTGGAGSSSQLPANLQQGLVAYYPFNGNANDESGNGFNGIVSELLPYVNDRIGNANSAIYFTGQNCNSQVSALINPNLIQGELSISFWVKKTELGCEGSRMMASYFSQIGILNNTNGHFQIIDNNSGFSINHILGSGSTYSSEYSNIEQMWTLISYVNDGVKGKFFKNGNFFDEHTNPIDGTITLGDKIILGHLGNTWSDDAFKGYMDDVMIWGRALTNSEIQQLYSAQSYAWNTGATTNSITVTPSTNSTYSCTVTSGSQTCTASVDITVSPQQTFYADADGDGFGNPQVVVTNCNQPTSYVTDNTDCNDNDASVYVASTESCNGLDDNCDGQVDEGLTLGSVTATSVTTALYPTCSGNALKSANLNNGANSPIIDGNGLDLWYSMTAQYNTLRAGLSAAFGDNEIRLYSYNSGCFELMETEHEVYTTTSLGTGNQVLISDDLIVGQTYYIAVHNISGAMNSSAKMCFNHFVGTTCDHYYSNNTGIYPNVCTSFKAQYKGNATNYIFDILSATQNNANLNITPWSYTTTTANSVVPRLGTIFPVNMSNAAKVYTMRIPVIYAIPDAAGNYTSITANATTTCTVTLNAELPIALRAADRCPNTKTTTSSISVDRTICGAQRYEWEFTQQLPSVQSPITVLGGLNTTVFFLNNVPGMGTGKTYNVRVRPIHANGEVGNWGTAQCLKTGTSGMVMQSESAVWANNYSPRQAVTLFPNPTSTGHFTLMSNAPEEEVKQIVITDITGKIVFQSQVVMNGNSMEVEFGDLATGMYLVMVGEERLRLVVE